MKEVKNVFLFWNNEILKIFVSRQECADIDIWPTDNQHSELKWAAHSFICKETFTSGDFLSKQNRRCSDITSKFKSKFFEEIVFDML